MSEAYHFTHDSGTTVEFTFPEDLTERQSQDVAEFICDLPKILHQTMVGNVMHDTEQLCLW